MLTKNIAEFDIPLLVLTTNKTEHTTRPGNDMGLTNHASIQGEPKTTSEQEHQEDDEYKGANF